MVGRSLFDRLPRAIQLKCHYHYIQTDQVLIFLSSSAFALQS